MTFTVRDLLWLLTVVALVLGQLMVSGNARDREHAIEHLVHKVDADCHDHLFKLSEQVTKLRDRYDDLDACYNSLEKRADEEGRRGVGIDATLSELITDKILREREQGKTKADNKPVIPAKPGTGIYNTKPYPLKPSDYPIIPAVD